MENQVWQILLVEDDEDDYILTQSLLTEAKGQAYSLHWAKSYEAGLEALEEERWDVILVDYHLGLRNGLELVREATTQGCRAPIIVLTGQGSYEVDLEAMQSGAVDYLVKGQIHAALLERTIRYAIERQQAQEALRRAHDELEIRVQERTQELAAANHNLRAEIAERARAELAVRESETKFRQLAETTSTAIFIVQEMTIRYANPAARFITGFETSELVQKEFWEIAHPTYQRILKANGVAGLWANLLNGGDGTFIPTRYELKLLTKLGGERWVDVSAGAIEYQGNPAWVVTAFDITERDLAEHALLRANEQLEEAKSDLEARVEARTAELRSSNELLEQANSQLAEANQLLQTIFETEPDGLAVLVGPELRVQFANSAFQALTPFREINPVGSSFEEVWSSSEDDGSLALLQSVLQTGEPVYGARLQRQAQDSSPHFFSAHASLLPSRDQPAVLLVVWETTRVVEAQRRAEEAAQEVRRQAKELDAVFTSMVDALIIYDLQGHPLLVNPAAIQLFGLELSAKSHLQLADELHLHNPGGERIAPKDLPTSRALLGETVKGQTVAFTSPSGDTHTFLASASPLVTGDSKWGMVTLWHDISERENLLGQLAAEQARLKAIIDNAPEGIMVANRYSQIVLVNPAAEELYSRPIPLLEPYETHASLQICYPDGEPYAPRDLPLTRSALDAEVYRNLETMVLLPDGSQRSLLFNSSPIFDVHGKVSGAVAVFQDITERKKEAAETLLNLAQIEVQRRLIQHRETERLLIAQELHDETIQGLIGLLFTINEAVLMTSRYLETAAIKTDEGESLLSKLNVIRVMLEQKIQDLRSFCSELRPPTLAPFGLEKAIRSYLEGFQRKHPRITVNANLMPDSRTLPENTRLALFRIFQEIMNNVIRHSQATEVSIRFMLNKEYVELSVTDNGTGFEIPTQWVELARQGHLGLVGARERAEAVGGEMQVIAHSGEGTLIQVHVPLQQKG